MAKFVFSQVMEYFPRWVFEKAVKKYNGDFHAKYLNSYSHCLHLMFGQMAGCKSLKDISLVLRSLKKSVYHLGIPIAVDWRPQPPRLATFQTGKNRTGKIRSHDL